MSRSPSSLKIHIHMFFITLLLHHVIMFTLTFIFLLGTGLFCIFVPKQSVVKRLVCAADGFAGSAET